MEPYVSNCYNYSSSVYFIYSMIKQAPIIGSAHNGPAFNAKSNPRLIALFIASWDESY